MVTAQNCINLVSDLMAGKLGSEVINLIMMIRQAPAKQKWQVIICLISI
jgi:hypothetical protein